MISSNVLIPAVDSTLIIFNSVAAITLQRHKENDQAKLHLMQFRDLFDALDDETKHADQDVIEQGHAIGRLLGV